MGESWNDRQNLIAAQDMAAPSTTVVTMQPQMFTLPDEVKIENWTSGICDCCEDMAICCLGLWCPCGLACQVSADFGECMCMPLLGIYAGLLPGLTMTFRSAIRERYRIQGSMCEDCCISSFCTICAWCQMAREIKMRRRRISNITTTTTTNIVTGVNMNPPPYAPQFNVEPQYPMSSGGYAPITSVIT